MKSKLLKQIKSFIRLVRYFGISSAIEIKRKEKKKEGKGV
jgi:hypothetical protein